MTAMQEFYSWLTPPTIEISRPPGIGDHAPTTERLKLPRDDKRPVVVTFLRHCGCPFAEKTFLRLRDAALTDATVHFIAVSHSNREHTAKWRRDLGGADDPPNLEILVDEQREMYAAWGLGVASFWHVLNPHGLYALYRMAKEEGIVNRPTESGYRWQTSGSWAVDGEAKVVWGGPVGSADEIPDLEEGAVHATRGLAHGKMSAANGGGGGSTDVKYGQTAT